MTIYKSTKVLPYVYMGTHRETGQFYIGSRTTKYLKLPPEQDLVKYRTSSKIVKPIFDEFDWTIVAMFFGPIDCYNFEQELIFELWGDPLKLNKICHHNQPIFNSIGWVPSAETREKISISNQGKIASSESKRKMSISKIGVLHHMHGKKYSIEHNIRLANSISRTWMVTNPCGQEFIITNLNKFCEENSLCVSNMVTVSKGRRPHHKGWKCIKLN